MGGVLLLLLERVILMLKDPMESSATEVGLGTSRGCGGEKLYGVPRGGEY